MRVVRFEEAAAYEAPNHFDIRSLRLQGFAPDGPSHFWVGMSHFLPSGHAGPDSSALEKVYVVIAGQLTVRAGGEEFQLRPFDSCMIPAGEMREVVNTSNSVATMLVVMPYPPATL